MSSVQECGSDGSCFPATTFGNTSIPPGFGPSNAALAPVDTSSLRSYRSNGNRHETFSDMDGDGDLDRAWIPQNDQTSIDVMLWDGTRFGAARSWIKGPAFPSDGGLPLYSEAGTHEAWLDMNGDGKTDRVWIPAGKKDLYVAMSTGTALGTPQIWLRDQVVPGMTSSSLNGLHEGFGDVDGNGLPDFVFIPPEGTEGETPMYVALNNGTSLSTPKVLFGRRVFPITSEDGRFEDFVDLNGDGLLDYTWIPKFDTITYVALANADTSLPSGVQLDNPTVWSIDDTRPPKDASEKDNFRTFEDVTGDRLADLVFYKMNGACAEIRVAINTGRKFLPSRVFSTSCMGDVPIGSRDATYHQFVDLNDDGRKDHVWIPSDRGMSWVAYSTGTSFGTPQQLWPGQTDFSDFLGIFFFDVDNDGSVDRLFLPANGNLAVLNKGNRVAHRLESITNGFGRQVSITYDTLANPAVYTQDHNALFPVLDAAGGMVVVSRTSISDGIGGFRGRSYRYEGLKMHLQGLGNLGMRRTAEFDEDRPSTLIRDFSQDYTRRLQGMIVGGTTVHLRADRNPSDPLEKQLAATTSFVNRYETSQSNGVFRTRLAKTDTVEHGLYDEFLSRRTTENLVVDAFGNTTSLRTAVYDAAGTVVGETVVTNEFTNDTTSWSLGLLTRSEVVRTLAANPGGSLKRVSTQSWNVTKRLLNNEVIEPDSPEFSVTTSYEYDPFGNRKRTTVAAAGVATRVSTAVYDETGRFPKESTNALNQTTKATYDERGFLTDIEDPNGLVATLGYDGYARRISEKKPDGTKSQATFAGCASGCPANAVYSLKIETDGRPPATQYFDRLGRVVRVQTTNRDGRTVIDDETYDRLGRAVKVSDPYFDGETAYATTAQYDALDRPTRVTNPDNTFSTIAYRAENTITVNELSQSRTETRDPLGMVTSVRDPAGSVVHYRYDEGSNLIEVRDPLDNLTTVTYDRMGRKKTLRDPDKGLLKYTYDPLGQLTSQTDAKGQVTLFAYDILGRADLRVEHDGEATSFTYDTGNKAIGALSRVAQSSCRGLERAACKTKLATTTDYNQTYGFDALGRADRVTTTIAGESFAVSNTFDAFSRTDVTTYPAGAGTALRVRNVYDDRGYLSEITNAGSNVRYWKAETSDARGNLTRSTLGNGLSAVRAFDAVTGQLKGIGAGAAGQPAVQQLAFNFDPLGNLKGRRDELQNITELVTYDNLNRMKSVELQRASGTETTTTDYDAIGNITQRSEVGEYGYGATCDGVKPGPHAVSSVGEHGASNPKTYCYDANGSMVRSGETQVDYAPFGKPVRFVQGATETLFAYGPSRERYRRVDATAAGNTTTTYVAGIFERSAGPEKTTYRYFIGDFAIYTETVEKGGAPVASVHYVHRDHLGSVDTVTDAQGKVVERYSYDPWGKRRNVDGSRATDPTAFSSDITLRGFGNQEQIDPFGLVHMNGRVYDPVIGRFLSADPFVQSPDNLQSFNRYAYVFNNPLSSTDPSGYFSFKKFAKRLFDRTFGKKSIYGAIIRGVRSALRGVAKVWAKVPGLEAVAGAAACFVGGPAGCIAFSQFSAAVQLSAGASLGDVLLGTAVASATGFGLDYGASSIAGTSVVKGFSDVTKGFLNFGLDQLSGGISGGVTAEALGMKFKDGFKSGTLAAAIQTALLPRTAFDANNAGSAAERYERAARNAYTAIARANAITGQLFLAQLELDATRQALQELEPVADKVMQAGIDLATPPKLSTVEGAVSVGAGYAVDILDQAFSGVGEGAALVSAGETVLIAGVVIQGLDLKGRVLELRAKEFDLRGRISSLGRERRNILQSAKADFEGAVKALEAEQAQSRDFR
ncbi:MAG: RHS repeat-associated core domain-containing protein [Polyangiaceae bacterium]